MGSKGTLGAGEGGFHYVPGVSTSGPMPALAAGRCLDTCSSAGAVPLCAACCRSPWRPCALQIPVLLRRFTARNGLAYGTYR